MFEQNLSFFVYLKNSNKMWWDRNHTRVLWCVTHHKFQPEIPVIWTPNSASMNRVGSPRVGERRKMYAEMGRVEWISANILKTAASASLVYYMAYRSMMEMEHSDWFLSRSIFSSPDRQMDRSDGSPTSRFVLLWTINLFRKLCCIVQRGLFSPQEVLFFLYLAELLCLNLKAQAVILRVVQYGLRINRLSHSSGFLSAV